jgi:hypothetical protein
MLPSLFFDTRPVDSFDALLSMFDGKAFASPFRSTVPLVALVKDAWRLLETVLDGCGVGGDLSVHFEDKVASRKGRGNPSQTDAMVLTDRVAVALEAKWTEPRYETVAVRLRREPMRPSEVAISTAEWRKQQEEHLDGWLELIRPHAAKRLCLADASEAVYQMVHRAASACCTSGLPKLIYLHFAPEPTGNAASTAQYRRDLTSLHSLLGSPTGFPFYLVELPLQPTAAFERIKDLKKGLSSTQQTVRSALLTSKLFEFGHPTIELIGGRLQ